MTPDNFHLRSIFWRGDPPERRLARFLDEVAKSEACCDFLMCNGKNGLRNRQNILLDAGNTTQSALSVPQVAVTLFGHNSCSVFVRRGSQWSQ